MKDLIACIAKALVDDPDGVEVTEIHGTQSSVIELKVSRQDVGKIIGRHGHTVSAIRTILRAASVKVKRRCVLELLE
ncbi:MAG: KH domain-containing protein [Deltaproteobacteria bacterium]|nr:KH domain-containing protein [Deltaproteobacteria bacterium]